MQQRFSSDTGTTTTVAGPEHLSRSIPPLPRRHDVSPDDEAAHAEAVRSDTHARPKRTNRARNYLAVGAFVAAGAVLAVRVFQAGTATTDQATVGARVTTIAAEGAGVVAEVLVDDHAVVEKGAPLLRFDTAMLDARIAGARAALASAEAMLEAARKRASVVGRQVEGTTVVARADEAAARAKQRAFEAEAARAQAMVDAAVVAADLANKELERVRRLHTEHVISAVQLDEARARAAQADAELRRARAVLLASAEEGTAALGFREAASGRVKLSTSGAEVDLARSDVALAVARVGEAKAALDLAELERTRATVTAPMRGVVEKRRVDPGTFVSAGTELLVLVSTDEIWIDAEFKEGQIARIARGQPATVEVDALPGVRLAGHVDNIGGATVARTSLLLANGNSFARTTQRVPVRIVLDERANGALAVGLNATVTVRLANR